MKNEFEIIALPIELVSSGFDVELFTHPLSGSVSWVERVSTVAGTLNDDLPDQIDNSDLSDYFCVLHSFGFYIS